MKFIRSISDLHLDWDIGRYRKTRLYDPLEKREWGDMSLLWFPEPMEGDEDTTLVIPGDLWIEHRFVSRKFPNEEDTWMTKVARQFKYVVFVLGNHDYWGCNLLYEADKTREAIKEAGLTNVFLLEKSMKVLDQVKFIGGTLWTDYDRHNMFAMVEAKENLIRDFKTIRTGTNYHKVQPNDFYERFMNTKSFIFENAIKDNKDQKLVVVTHMAPSFNSVQPNCKPPVTICNRELLLNHSYYSDLEERIKVDGKDIDYWLHGHCHYAQQYVLDNKNGGVKVLLNPRGYDDEQTEFDPLLRITL